MGKKKKGGAKKKKQQQQRPAQQQQQRPAQQQQQQPQRPAQQQQQPQSHAQLYQQLQQQLPDGMQLMNGDGGGMLQYGMMPPAGAIQTNAPSNGLQRQYMSNNADDESSNSTDPPPLLDRRQQNNHADSSDDDDDSDPPPLMPRREQQQQTIVSSDSDDSDGPPELIERRQYQPGDDSSDESNSSDDDNVPHRQQPNRVSRLGPPSSRPSQNQTGSDSDDSSNGPPPLMERQQRHVESSSDEEEEDMPPARGSASNIQNKNQNSAAQQLQQQELDDSEYNDLPFHKKTRDLLIGDRVFILDNPFDHENDPSYRGVIQSKPFVKGALQKIHYYVSPVNRKLDPGIAVAWDRLLVDNLPLMSRFKRGEEVLAHLAEGNWCPVTVTHIYPPNEYDGDQDPCIPAYRLRLKNPQQFGYQTHQKLWYAPSDDDGSIKRLFTTFRCKKGDDVLINTAVATFDRNKPKSNVPTWVRGKVVQVNSYGIAIYKCRYSVPGQKRSWSCQCVDDSDYHIALVRTPPRQRLFDAIEQNCGYDHFQFLVDSNGLDVAGYTDALLEAAVKAANYDALLWLQEELSVNLLRAPTFDSKGGGLLHSIAESQQADRFFEDVLEAEERKLVFKTRDSDSSNSALIVDVKDREGQFFTNRMIESGNLRALELVLSRPALSKMNMYRTVGPDMNILTDISSSTVKLRKALVGTKKVNPELSLFLRTFEQNVFLHWLRLCLSPCGRYRWTDEKIKSTIQQVSAVSSDDTITTTARRFVNFCKDPDDSYSESYSIDEVLCELATHVRPSAVDWLYKFAEASPPSISRECRVDRFEFGQPEIEVRPSNKETLDIISAVVHGKRRHFFDVASTKRMSYREFMLNLPDEKFDLVSALEEWSRTHDKSGEIRFYEYKISLLRDAPDLEDRIAVLKYLMKTKFQPAPHALDAIRFRQNGILRWLCDEKILYLDSPACKSLNLLRWDKELPRYLNGTKFEKLPKSINAASVLIFACIEYDDLLSLQWILYQRPTFLDDIAIGGWNPVHAIAFFGRTEIFRSLRSWKIQFDVNKRSERKPWRGYYPLQLAVSNGFTDLAERMIDAGAVLKVSKGKSIAQVAKQSGLDHVKKWGASRERSDRMASSLSNLNRMISQPTPMSLENIKKHIQATSCLCISRWCEDCDVYDSFTKGPTGKSFIEVLTDLLEIADSNFILWLMEEVDMERDDRGLVLKYFWEGENNFSRQAKVTFMTQDEILEVVAQSFESTVVEIVRMRVLQRLQVKNPRETLPDAIKLALSFYEQREKFEIVSTLANGPVGRHRLVSVAEAVATELNNLLIDMFVAGAPVQDAEEIARALLPTIACLQQHSRSHEKGLEIKKIFCLLGLDGRVQADELFPVEDDYSLSRLFSTQMETYNLQFNQVLALEGHAGLMRWTLLPSQNSWTAEQEVESARIASFYGHSGVLDLLLIGDDNIVFKSDATARMKAAAVGAARSRRFESFRHYLQNSGGYGAFTPLDQLNWEPEQKEDRVEEPLNEQKQAFPGLADNPTGSAVIGYIRGPPSMPNQVSFELLSWIINSGNDTPANILRAAIEVLLHSHHDFLYAKRSFDLFHFLVDKHDVKVSKHSGIFLRYLGRVSYICGREESDNGTQLLVEVLGFLTQQGIDIQESSSWNRTKSVLEEAKKKQLEAWQRFKRVPKITVEELRIALETESMNTTSYDQNGLTMIHLAAANDRKDIVAWLNEHKGISLALTDVCGRSVLDVARASGATKVFSWIQEKRAASLVGQFICSQYRMRKERARYFSALFGIKELQAVFRGRRSRYLNRGRLEKRLELVANFNSIWGEALESYCHVETSKWVSWARLKSENVDINRWQDLSADFEEITESAMTMAAAHSDENGEEEEESDSVAETAGDCLEQESMDFRPPSLESLEKIQMTKEVVKWIRGCHPTYRDFFLRRVKQLAAGDRSRILAKGLVGSKTRIFETYLEQKSGFRILWTKMAGNEIRIWYVAKHDDVSRLVKLIDCAEERSTRSLVTAASQFETSESVLRDSIVLDPFGNTPMKLYEVTFDEVDQIMDRSWSPPLHLTPEEQTIVQTPGTVLLLGRSGTGKTVCICNRMDYDWRVHKGNPTFSQLFVARSAKLRNFVRNTVTGFDGPGRDDDSRSFQTFARLIHLLETKLSNENIGDVISYPPSHKMTFQRFYDEVHIPGQSQLGAMIIWKNIQTFLKGSAESLLSPDGGLSKSEYLALGSNQCRLSSEQREEVYKSYERYREFVSNHNLWDSSDRMRHLISRIRTAIAENPPVWDEIRRSKIYVDEIQDYTQAEILLFFLMSGPGSLFLAGDPAQSVVEGTDFRFKDIRSVGYHLFGEDQKHLIPDKPKIVSLNFRSHNGVLKIASAVLECLFRSFPKSTESLLHDHGFFEGPRPGILYKVTSDRLLELSKRVQGITFLTYDDHVPELRQSLNQYPLVFGIREAKGLEFHSVVLVDLFGKIPQKNQKRWRDLLLGRDLESIRLKFPEIESDLKLMYTGVTRCINSLWFAERKRSEAGDAALRFFTTTTVEAWNQTNALAVKQVVDDVEAMSRTSDEWIVAGLDNAIMAEQEDIDPKEAMDWMNKALYCFDKSGDKSWGSKARCMSKTTTLLHNLQQLKQKLRDNSNDDAQEEARREVELHASEQIKHLLEERLILEAKKVIDAISPLLSDFTRDRLERGLVSMLPSDQDLEDLL
mmetsp:Transcript_29648/g.81504  ORF Transcript_29648/g.81504 Transcript_29648/m.81504 type:complete len:2695 (-) Transcript_29648:60-8144(-)